jgi:hypothetical protein
VGEADDRADRDVGAGKDRHGAWNVDGAHAHGRHVVLRREAAAVLDERVVELGPQQGMVDGLRDVALGEGLDRKGVGHVSGNTA